MFKFLFLFIFSASLAFSNSLSIPLNKEFYFIDYSPYHKGPLKVSYFVSSDKINLLNIKKRPDFYHENSLSFDIRVFPEDFTNTGFDRGHMAPDANFDWSLDSLNSTYSMANISPQYPVVNQKIWANIEELERYNVSQFKTLDVINLVDYSNFTILEKEPVSVSLNKYLEKHSFKNDSHRINYIKKKQKAFKYLQDKQIHVPSGFYKIMENKSFNFKECFYVPNKPDLTNFDPQSYKIDCSSIKEN